MSIRPLRPTFVLRVSASADEASDRLQDLLRSEKPRVRGQAVKHHTLLTLTDRERRFWSPWLSLEIRKEVGVEETRVYGRFSPEPGIWMGFTLIYLALGTLALFAGVFGIAQWMLGSDPVALFAMPLLALIGIGIWLVARTGQKLAADEMHELRGIIEQALGIPL